MRDKETDSYWSIMSENSLAGPATGLRLHQLPGTAKVTWAEWLARHPETLVLTHQARQHVSYDPYFTYFKSSGGFAGITARDHRLADKSMVFTFRAAESPVAVPHRSFSGGGTVQVGDRWLFLYREEGDSVYRGSTAYLAPPGGRFIRKDGGWVLNTASEDWVFNRDLREFTGMLEAVDFRGFDTFWYIWSLTNPTTQLLQGQR